MRKSAVLFTLLVLCPALLFAQTLSERPNQVTTAPAGTPNADPTYQALRHVTVGSEAITVSNATLQRDAATFVFASGTFYLLAPVNGKITGAVFVGAGSIKLVPPIPMERRSLALLTNGAEYVENFDHAVFRFTDGTDADLRKLGTAGTPASTSDAASALNASQNDTRTGLRYNITARLLEDVLSPSPGGFFAAFISGKTYSGHTLFLMDPHGALAVAPEEIELTTYDENKYGIWAAFHYSAEYAKKMATGAQQNAQFDIDKQELDTTIEKSAKLTGTARTTFFAGTDGVRVVMLDLFPTLRVSGVAGENGEPLQFIQEDKKEDADFAVILPRALNKNDKYTITTTYSGKDAVSNEGNGNYFPIARLNWYPNTTFGDYAEYHMTFRTPKGMKVIASGTLEREVDEGGQTISQWRSEVPQAVAGFNFGAMQKQEAKVSEQGYMVEAFANNDLPDFLKAAQRSNYTSASDCTEDANGSLHCECNERDSMGRCVSSAGALGSMSTVPMMKKALVETQAAVALYTEYFGPAPYKHVAVTQQTACGFGQAWPALVYLPICSFLDDTTRHELLRNSCQFEAGAAPVIHCSPTVQAPLISYFRVVTPHEVAHQWWAHTVGFNSYRDQWMSEGFAQFSASLFLQKYNNAEYAKFLEEQRHLLADKDRDGFRANDVGPIVMGFRLDNSRTDSLGSGVVYRSLIYPKGAFILHMIRMMMWSSKTGDQDFKAMMHDFTSTYANRTASTEDFKAMVEKHLPPGLDFTKNGKLDWFFNEWVYGTALPSYSIDASFTTGDNGDQVLVAKITQSKVDQDFFMPVPIYLELADGRVVRVGAVPMLGNSTRDLKVPLNGLKVKPKRAFLNAHYDVLTGE